MSLIGTFLCGSDATNAPDTSGGAWVGTPTITATTKEWPAGPCWLVGGSVYRTESGNFAMTLSVEDTDEDALDRLLAVAEWSAWTAVGVLCLNPPCCEAIWEERTSGFSFQYFDAEYQVYQEGMTPGASYDIEVDIYRAPVGSDEYELFATQPLGGTVDGFGVLQVEFQVPNELGYKTYAASPARLTLA